MAHMKQIDIKKIEAKQGFRYAFKNHKEFYKVIYISKYCDFSDFSEVAEENINAPFCPNAKLVTDKNTVPISITCDNSQNKVLIKMYNFKIVKKVISFLKESSRYKHIAAGVLVGSLSSSLYCSALAGSSAAFACEYKDKLYGNAFDCIDVVCTVSGSLIGFALKIMVFKWF